MNIYRIIFVLLFVVFTYKSNCQLSLIEVDFDKIEQEKIREYITHQRELNINTLSDIKPSLNSTSSIDGYRTKENEYLVKEHFSKVWKLYVSTNPCKSWSGKKVSFGVLLSKKEKRIVYKDEKISKLDTGQVVYLNLRLFKGLKNMATAFELINIDSKNQIIEFSYLDGNLSEGKQRLTFYETPKGYTRIIHTSYFKSSSALMDYFLYPFFHTRITNEFHRNMKRLLLIE